jgi:hypothetical protein
MTSDWNGARRETATSPLRGEVARNARVGVTLGISISDASVRGGITPPRTFGPTLPLKGRVR